MEAQLHLELEYGGPQQHSTKLLTSTFTYLLSLLEKNKNSRFLAQQRVEVQFETLFCQNFLDQLWH